MRKKLVLLGLTLALTLAASVPAFAAATIGAAVGEIQVADGAALGNTGGVACRIYATDDTVINANFGGTCANSRCPRNYVTLSGFGNPGGYNCNGENTGAYASDADQQTFYNVMDGEVNDGLPTHAAFYAVQGQIAGNGATTTNPGSNIQAGCAASGSQNCFTRADNSNSDTRVITTAKNGYPSGHSLSRLGGLSPVPTVNVLVPGTCLPGQAQLTWNDPASYAAAMKNGVPTPVKGVRLWSNPAPCSTGTGNGPSGATTDGWVPGATFGPAAGTLGTCVSATPQGWYALTVRFIGPGGGSNEIESGIVGGSGFVGPNSQCLGAGQVTHITRVDARYAGRGTVNVSWTSGIEGDVQGYFVARATSASGPYTRVSEQVSNRRVDNSDYTFSDKVRASLGRALYYQIQVVKSDGTVEASGAASVSLPSAKPGRTTN